MERGTVFIIEDEFTQKVALADALKKENLEVATGSGENVMAQIVNAKPALVITDINTGPGEPTSFIEKIKGTEQLKGVGIFVYTQKVPVSLEVQLRRLKLMDYFIKDQSTDFIVKSIKGFFEPEQEVDASLMDAASRYDMGLPPPVVTQQAAPQPQAQKAPPPPADDKEAFGEMFQEFSDKVHAQLGDQDAETVYNLGISYMDMELFQEAINEFERSMADGQFRGESICMIGVCLRKMKKYDESIEKLKQGAKFMRDPVELNGVKYEISLTLTEAGRLKEAFGMLASIYKQDKSYRDVGRRLVAIKKKLQG